MATSERAQDLARQFEQVNGELIALVEGCSDQDWHTICAGENWPVNVTAHHVAVAYPFIAQLVQAVAERRSANPPSREAINAQNAQHAEQFKDCTREEVLSLLQQNGASAVELVRGLSDRQLDTISIFATMGMASFSTADLVERILIGHPRTHMRSIRAALGR